METLYLDTHIVVWLRQKELEKFSKRALDAIENASMLLISPMVMMELKYLQEIGRLTDTPYNILGDLNAMIDLRVDEVEMFDVIKKSLSLEWTRDPFDRLIVANAMARDYPLLTKDEKILTYFEGAFFE
jgi:PIN domain nuclease of toxin-antitoxin system